MNNFVKILDWSYDFGILLPDLLDIVKEKELWAKTNNSFCIVEKRELVSFEIFKKIESSLNDCNIQIIRGVLRQSFPKRFTEIHTDSVRVESVTDLLDLGVALNIPLKNANTALTHWYDFSENKEINIYNIKISDNFTKLSSLFSIDYLLKHKVFTFTMNGPVVINTSIPHNVDTRHSGNNRFILSLQLMPADKPQMLTWEKANAIASITL